MYNWGYIIIFKQNKASYQILILYRWLLLIFFKYHSYVIDIDSVKILTVSTIATRLLHVPFDTHFFPPQLLSRVRLFATPWTAAHQASLSITNSQSLLKLMPIESVMPSNHHTHFSFQSHTHFLSILFFSKPLATMTDQVLLFYKFIISRFMLYYLIEAYTV